MVSDAWCSVFGARCSYPRELNSCPVPRVWKPLSGVIYWHVFLHTCFRHTSCRRSTAKSGSTSRAETASALITPNVFINVECSLDIFGDQPVMMPVYGERCTVPGVRCKVFVSAALELLPGISYLIVLASCHLLASLSLLRIRLTSYVCSAVKTGWISPAASAMYVHSWICMITYD